MNSLTRFIVSLLALLTVSMPAFAFAAKPNSHIGETGVIQTPYSLRGKFIFISRVSRRSLLLETQAQTITPVWLPKEII